METDHDNVARQIKAVVASHTRSHMSSIKKYLHADSHSKLCDGDGTSLRTPVTFTCDEIVMVGEGCTDSVMSENQQAADAESGQVSYFPPAEVSEGGFTIAKFYTMNPQFVRLLLREGDAAQLASVHIPFHPDEREHFYISLTPDPPQSLMLIGRSG